MSDFVEYRFTIDSMAPDELPMSRLAQYVGELATLLGHHDSVHFGRVEAGSTVLVSRVAFAAAPKVRERLREGAYGSGPEDLRRAVKALDRLLADDNAIGALLAEGDVKILDFPGRCRPIPATYGPFNEEGSLDGVLIRVGGAGEAVHAQLQDGVHQFTVDMTRDQARHLGQYLFEPVRVRGLGRWFRNADGEWELRSFRMYAFEPLDDSALSEVVRGVREGPRGAWSDMDDPLAVWRDMRGSGGVR